MRKNLLLVSVAIAAVLQLGCAQRGPGPGMRALVKPDMAPCLSNNDCRVPVYVSVAANGECRVQMLFETVTVGQGKQPMVVWRLEKADPDGDSFDYRFDPNTGVVIEQNNPATDFDNPGHMGGNPRKFMWKSKNLRRMGFDYAMTVQRRANPADAWSNCRLLDPRIVNEGA